MARISVIRNTYGGPQYLQNALNYVTDSRATFVRGYGVNPYDTNMSYDQMMAVRQYFGKTSGNPLVHIVVAYNNQVQDIDTAAMYGNQWGLKNKLCNRINHQKMTKIKMQPKRATLRIDSTQAVR